MIFAIVGKPGGGKSYEAVRYHILPAITEDKRKVVTNIPINKSHLRMVYGAEIADLVEVVEGDFHNYGGERAFSSHEHFLQYQDWKNEKGQCVLFVVDEAHLPLGREAKKTVTEFLSMHRHYGFDIGLMTQNQRKLNRDVRDMVDTVFHCAKMQIYGKEGYVRKLYHGFDNMRDPIQLEERSYSPEYFDYYQSHTKSDSSIKEATVKDAGAKLNPYAKITKIFFVLGPLIIIFAIFRAFGVDDDDDNKTQNTNTSPKQAEELPLPKTPEQQKRDAIEKKQKEQIAAIESAKTINEKIEKNKKHESAQYHPFNKVRLHVEGRYEDVIQGQSNIYYAASMNGQRVFRLTLKDLALAGYTVRVLGDCLTELQYYDYREFITCDVPTQGVEVNTIVAKN